MQHEGIGKLTRGAVIDAGSGYQKTNPVQTTPLLPLSVRRSPRANLTALSPVQWVQLIPQSVCVSACPCMCVCLCVCDVLLRALERGVFNTSLGGKVTVLVPSQ